MTPREQNIQERRARIEARLIAHKTNRAELELAAFGYAVGRNISEPTIAAVKLAMPEIYSAAEALRADEIGRFLTHAHNEDVLRIFRHDKIELQQKLDDEARELGKLFFGPAAAEATLGHGEYPPAPAAEVKGTAVTFTNINGLDALVAITPLYSHKFRESPRAAHFRTIRVCNQILSEVSVNGDFLHLSGLFREDADRLKDRLRKDNQRGGRWRYLVLPQDGGFFDVIHNRPSEGGRSLDELTHYDKTQLYNFLFPLLQTPEGARVQASESFGRLFQGMKGDGRKKAAEKAGCEVETFQVKSGSMPDEIGRLLGIDVNLNTMRGSKIFDSSQLREIGNALIREGDLQEFAAPELAKFNKFLEGFGELSRLRDTNPNLNVSLSRDIGGKLPLQEAAEARIWAYWQAEETQNARN